MKTFLTRQYSYCGKNMGIFFAPEIVAKTGWTTDELTTSIDNTVFLLEYDIVSLLIGVNNQYRGRSVEIIKKSSVYY
jgi:hypothetical protein